MRALISLLFVAVSQTACAESDFSEDLQVVPNDEFARSYVWSRVPSDGWATLPTLVLARRAGLYPSAPDVEVAFACDPDGTVTVSGNAYEFATDVGAPPHLAARFSLRSNFTSLTGEPIWEGGSFSQRGHFILRPTANDLSRLINGDWFEVGGPFADGSGAVRYPAPPRAITTPFLQDCGYAPRGR
jgi:hypothetical protein